MAFLYSNAMDLGVLGFRVWGLRLRVAGFGIEVQGCWLGVCGSRVQGSGCTAPPEIITLTITRVSRYLPSSSVDLSVWVVYMSYSFVFAYLHQPYTAQ